MPGVPRDFCDSSLTLLSVLYFFLCFTLLNSASLCFTLMLFRAATGGAGGAGEEAASCACLFSVLHSAQLCFALLSAQQLLEQVAEEKKLGYAEAAEDDEVRHMKLDQTLS